MNNPFRTFYRQYLSFSKKDRNAILILSILIIISFVAGMIVDLLPTPSKYNYSQNLQLLKELEAPEQIYHEQKKMLFYFDPNTADLEMLDSLDIPVFIKHNILNYRNAGGRFYSLMELRKIYGMNDSIFDRIKNYVRIESKGTEIKVAANKEKEITGSVDPNIADYGSLVNFGFSSFQSKNIVEYRNKGGIFKMKEDLLKIYGIDSVFFKSIENNIIIIVSNQTEFINKKLDLHIELNSADSIDLVKLDGIGPVYANRILKYRDLLGGFYSVSQLLEVYSFSEETYRAIEESISADTLLIKKIRLNFAEYNELLRHPYLNKIQVDAILNYRNKKGPFKTLQQLKSEGLVDAATFDKICCYLTCR